VRTKPRTTGCGDARDYGLRLIDRPHRIEIESIRRETEQLVSDLKAIGAQLRTVRSELEKKRAEIKELDQLRLELGSAAENRPQLPPTLEEQHAVFMRRQRLLELLNEVQTIQRRAMSRHWSAST
jgi:predicted  nucleic acid-binding Zn-ribbon protein